MYGSRCECRRKVVELQRPDVNDHQHPVNVGIEVTDLAILLDCLAGRLGGVQERLVVQQLLKRVVSIKLGEQERRISEPWPCHRKRVPLEELHRSRRGGVLRVVGHNGQPLRRDVASEHQRRRARRRGVVQFVIVHARSTTRQIA